MNKNEPHTALFVESLLAFHNVNSSQPKRYAVTDSGTYVLKVPVLEQKTNRILENELLGALLAERVGLKTAPTAVLRVTGQTQQGSDVDQLANGFYFGSLCLANRKPATRYQRFDDLVADIRPESLYVLHALDVALLNPDRKAADLLIAPPHDDNVFVPIDFSGAFGLSCWEPSDLEDSSRFLALPGYVDECIYRLHGGKMQRSATAIATVSGAARDVAEIIGKLEKLWHLGVNVGGRERGAIAALLEKRLAALDDLVTRDIERNIR